MRSWPTLYPLQLPPVPPHLAERVNEVNRLVRNWWQLHQNLGPFARLLASHAFGWVAATDKRYGSDDEDWPAEARFPLRAAGFVLDNVVGILNAEAERWWGDTPVNCVRPLAPWWTPTPRPCRPTCVAGSTSWPT